MRLLSLARTFIIPYFHEYDNVIRATTCNTRMRMRNKWPLNAVSSSLRARWEI